MKKILFFAAAAIMMVGCSKDQVLSKMPQDNAINFGMYFGRDAQSRAAIMDLDDLKDQSFGVFAYHTDDHIHALATPNFMFNQIVEWDGTAWTYAPLKYWPNEKTDYLSFFAYAPHIDEANGHISINPTFTNASASSAPSINYTFSTQSTHVDLLWAAEQNLQKHTTTGPVKLNFKHALSRIGFKTVAVIDESSNNNNGNEDSGEHTNPLDANTTITLKRIILRGGFYESATLDLSNGFWYNWSSNLVSDDFWWTGPDFKESNVTTTKTEVLKDDQYLTVIPNYEAVKNIRIEVLYTVRTEDPALDGGYSEVYNTIMSEPFDFTFYAGYAYNFVLHIGLNSVKFSAEVADWDKLPDCWEGISEKDIVVNVPLNN